MDSQPSTESLSESVEMYLLRIALLQEDDRPVPISALAEEMAVSPVSANQMCRRLEERGAVHYEPYKGVRLTLHGEAVAMRVLRKRRLWEVFLAEKLGLDPKEAEEIACRFEHVTPDVLGERLAEFLGNPKFSPQHEPIPASLGEAVRRPRLILTALQAGHAGRVVDIEGDEATRSFLRSQGIAAGAAVKVMAAAADGGLLVQTPASTVTLSGDVAQHIVVNLQRSAPTPTPDPAAA